MPYRAFLARIRELFDHPTEHLEWIADGFARGRLEQPVTPMTDAELARAIREFQQAPPSSASLEKLGAEFSRKR